MRCIRNSILLCFLLCGTTLGAAEKPDLVVVVSIDQLPASYLERFGPWLTTRGFKRFTTTFPNARFRHGITYTAPGHAGIGTGGVPAQHGIVANNWFEPDAPFDEKRWQKYFADVTPYRPPNAPASTTLTAPTPESRWFTYGSPRYCVADDELGMSPRSLLADGGLAERLKAASPQSRVISVALKERAAILMGGRRADAAYWFESREGFHSSPYYEADPAALAFNALVPGYVPHSKLWKLSGLIPRDDLARVTFDPPAAWPLKNTKFGATFDHPIGSTSAFLYTPFAHEMLLDFALHVLATSRLGTRRGITDALFVGVSSVDYLGHYYGPDSMEVADSTARLDRSLGAFLDALERRFGDRVVVALTSDHGLTPHPEITKLRDPKADTGRLDLRNAPMDGRTIAELPPPRIELERLMARRLGIPFSTDAPLREALVYFFREPSLFLNRPRIAALNLDPERVRIALRDAVLTLPGVNGAWTSTQLLNVNASSPRIEQLMRASYHPQRSGDVLLALRPGWIWKSGSNSTSHGQPNDSDLRVPVMLYGTGIKPGRYDVEASPADLPATIGRILGIEVQGRVLPCVN
jgi:predicted AlkP superfamily pyrophosphatase or phosphodiesterase